MENVDESAAAKRRTGGADPLAQVPRQGDGGAGPGEGDGGEDDPSDKPQEPIAPDERGD